LSGVNVEKTFLDITAELTQSVKKSE